jgi:hypothetical protein
MNLVIWSFGHLVIWSSGHLVALAYQAKYPNQ